MQARMAALGLLAGRRRGVIVGVWVLLLLVSVPFASKQTDHLTGGGFEVPGSGSNAVDQQIKRFQGASSENLGIVLQRRDGGDAAAVVAAIDRVKKAADDVDGVAVDGAAIATARQQAASQPVVLVPLQVAGNRDSALDAAKDLRDEIKVDKVTDGVQPYVVGQQGLWAGMQDLQQEDLSKAESAGFPVILIVLLAVFGSLIAALLPVGLGVAAVTASGAVIYFLAQATEMSVFVTNVSSMLGIGVAVDYSLFLLSRYREEVAAGKSLDAARRTAMRTSGSTIVFSGATVVVSLAGLFMIDSTVIRSLAIGAIVVVSLAVLGAVTLLPALLALLGDRAIRRGRVVSATGTLLRRVARRPDRAAAPDRAALWERWSNTLMRRPAIFAAIAAVLMIVIAIPALSLKFGNGALRQFPADHETRVGAELAGKITSPGEAAPVLVVADFRTGDAKTGANAEALNRYVAELKGLPGVARVSAAQSSEDGGAALLRVVTTQDPESDQALALVDRMRAEGGRASGLSGVAAIDIGGASAQTRDFANQVSDGLWKIFIFVMICSYLVLLVVLRSVLLPLKAVLMNLLSVGAAYGVLVAVFQYGWLDGITGYESLGYINAMTPPLLLAIVFGLSMDYEVFLLSRIRERYLATGDNRRAVGEGLAASAKVISSAAIIMVVVFATFALTGVPQVKEIGVGLSVAIALDATLVRLILVPATMELMGDWNWYLPSWLDRILPHADFETDDEAEGEVPPPPSIPAVAAVHESEPV